MLSITSVPYGITTQSLIESILKANNFALMNGSEFYFIYIPDKIRYFEKNFDKNKHDYKKVINFCLLEQL